jgi:hypothetical protein
VFAYRIPLNPYDPQADRWATLVQPDRIRVGDRLDELTWTEATDEELTTRGSPDEWEVIAVEPTGDEGRSAVLHRKLAPEAIWDGSLVLRLVRGHS